MRDERLKDHVVARSSVEHVLAAAADQHVVTGTTEQSIVSGATDENVGTVAAVKHELRPTSTDSRGRDHVVTAEAVDTDRVAEIEVIDHHTARQAVDHQRAVLERE